VLLQGGHRSIASAHGRAFLARITIVRKAFEVKKFIKKLIKRRKHSSRGERVDQRVFHKDKEFIENFIKSSSKGHQTEKQIVQNFIKRTKSSSNKEQKVHQENKKFIKKFIDKFIQRRKSSSRSSSKV
jgi:hypothetical protein